ncbi:MAG: hypothetical protein SGARI_002114 [Bacillariaceae sp.]
MNISHSASTDYGDFVLDYDSDGSFQNDDSSNTQQQNTVIDVVEETDDDDDNDSAVIFDEDQLVAQAHPSEVFEEGKRQHTSNTSITSSDIEDFNLPAEYYGDGGAQEYQIEDWESYRGLEHVSYNHSYRIHQQASHRRSSQRRASSRVVGRKKQQQYYEDSDDSEYELDNRPGCLLIFTICLLFVELAAAMIAVIYYEPLVECCGDSFVSNVESTTQLWNEALFGISIGYLCWVIVDMPIVAISKEPVFLFNPLIGYLLALHMFYVTNVTYAYVIYGLETAAMLGQSYVLIQLRRNAEICIHSIFNFTMCGIVVYALIELSRQGGYCIVDGQLEGVFTDPTCDTRCLDEAACNICDGNATSCFIGFPSMDEL